MVMSARTKHIAKVVNVITDDAISFRIWPEAEHFERHNCGT